jgi:hypothetical protein
LFVLAMLAGWGFFGPKATAPAMQATAAIASGDPRDEAQVADDRELDCPLLLRRLDYLMTVERIDRQEGLSIGGLAAKLNLSEYRLRQVINEGLGDRNFNAFLKPLPHRRYQGDAVRPEPTDVQALTIAMDA